VDGSGRSAMPSSRRQSRFRVTPGSPWMGHSAAFKTYRRRIGDYSGRLS